MAEPIELPFRLALDKRNHALGGPEIQRKGQLRGGHLLKCRERPAWVKLILQVVL